MDDGIVTTSDLLRLVGFMSVGVGLAWAFQVVGFGTDGSAFGQLMWVVGAAAIAGAGAGTLYIARRLGDEDNTAQA